MVGEGTAILASSVSAARLIDALPDNTAEIEAREGDYLQTRNLSQPPQKSDQAWLMMLTRRFLRQAARTP